MVIFMRNFFICQSIFKRFEAHFRTTNLQNICMKVIQSMMIRVKHAFERSRYEERLEAIRDCSLE